MKGIINKTIATAYKKRKSLLVVKRYLQAKHKIKVSLSLLRKRFKNMPVIRRETKDW